MPESERRPSCSDEPAFEACLAELQDVVRALEEGSLGLDESISRFERGISLLRSCYKALERAEQKIELLTGFDRNGNAMTAPFDAAATLDSSQAPGQPGQQPGQNQGRPSRKKGEPETDLGLSLPKGTDADPQLF